MSWMQIVCAALVGALNRGLQLLWKPYELPIPVQAVGIIAMILMGPGAILPVWFLSRRAGLPSWKREALAVVEIALLFVYLLAIFPAVQ